MIDIHIRDNNFFSEKYPERPNPYFNWIWDRSPVDSDITVFSDSYIKEVETSNSRVKIAWLIEPPVINSFIYEYASKNIDKFDLIFTFDEDLLKLGDNVRYYPYGTTWIGEEDRAIHDKSKILSAVFSDKKMTKGHGLRHEIYASHKNEVDFFGAINNNRIEHKITGHKDYAFSLIVENWTGNSYFSEKLLDCLLTGTIPVYWGFSKFNEFFDPNGFVYFTEASQLRDIIPYLTMDNYTSRLDAVKENFKRALNYIDLEENLWKRGLKGMVNKG
jgi:hypothetical protein